jgi:hypothetical protein
VKSIIIFFFVWGISHSQENLKENIIIKKRVRYFTNSMEQHIRQSNQVWKENSNYVAMTWPIRWRANPDPRTIHCLGLHMQLEYTTAIKEKNNQFYKLHWFSSQLPKRQLPRYF